jgi:DNA ligase-1
MKILEQIFGKEAYTKPNTIFKLAETTLVSSTEELELLFNKYTALNLEGIIAKDDDTEYKPGTRNFDWIKLKASSSSELVDTIDAVVLGYYYGEGQRARFGIGAILIGLYDKDTDRYVSLTKVGTGFKDADWAKIKATLDPLTTKAVPDYVTINKLLMPDVLVEPKIVVVVEADSISQSKIHGDQDGGIATAGLSLRFPRIKVFGRDKNPEDATTVKELRQMYSFQQQDFGKPVIKSTEIA